MRQQAVEKYEKGFTCLVADDSRFARANIAKLVSSMGGEVVGEASNGFEAVELFSKLKPDLVLLDITMPELDGLEALSRIMEQDRNARVIIVSALGNREKVKQAIGLGAIHFVTKPIKAQYVSSIIRASVDAEEGGV